MRQLFTSETLTAVACVIWQMCFHLLVWTLTHFWVGHEVPVASPDKGVGTQFFYFHSPQRKVHFYVYSWGHFCIVRHVSASFYRVFIHSFASVTHGALLCNSYCNLDSESSVGPHSCNFEYTLNSTFAFFVMSAFCRQMNFNVLCVSLTQ